MPHSSSTVSRALFEWLDTALSQRLPENTFAFHFNLYEGIDSVHIQLIGTDSFDAGEVPERDYWPGSETFTTGEEVFEIPFDVAGSDWKQWIATCKNMLSLYISTGQKSDILRSSNGIGVGFVDGDMHVLWQPNDA